jgi:hypothetical protein
MKGRHNGRKKKVRKNENTKSNTKTSAAVCIISSDVASFAAEQTRNGTRGHGKQPPHDFATF